jgi:rubrerythrin
MSQARDFIKQFEDVFPVPSPGDMDYPLGWLRCDVCSWKCPLNQMDVDNGNVQYFQDNPTQCPKCKGSVTMTMNRRRL